MPLRMAQRLERFRFRRSLARADSLLVGALIPEIVTDSVALISRVG